MRPRTCILSAFTLSTAMFFGISAMAADLPKEGTFSGMYSSLGTAKAIQIGKERLLLDLDENGQSLGKGLVDHMAWHCWGTGDFANGVGQYRGYCVGTDPVGDQIVGSFASEKTALDAKGPVNGSLTLTTGTGKYAGITGVLTYVYHGNEFHPLAGGAYLAYGTQQGSYKLP
jgi:hypothetical protein